MKDNVFIDTNIFVYSFDIDDKVKRKIAIEIIKKSLLNTNSFISIQVIQEFFNVSLKKFSKTMNHSEAKIYLENVFMQINIIYPGYDLISEALDIQTTTKYSWYDSLIIAAALQANCNLLLSEDMQDGQQIRNLTIKNPFSPTS